MSYEHPEQSPNQQTSNAPPASTERRDGDAPAPRAANDDARPATVLVRGETVKDPGSKSTPTDSKPATKAKTPPKAVSDAKLKMQGQLPALADDADVGVQKQQVVIRDDKADLAFTGTLVASAAPPSAPTGKWQEYRIYETSAGKHVFSKAGRSIYAEDQDTHEAEIFDPSPDSMPSQLMRSARDLTRSKPVEWTDAAVDFFGYDPLAKALYRKVSGKFEEHIS